MRAQIVFEKGTEHCPVRAQGTDRAQNGKMNCALINPSFYYSFLLKGTGNRINNRLGIIAKTAKNSDKWAKQGFANRNRRIWNKLCPLPSVAFRGAVA